MHYYSFNISDWAVHTSHLTLEEEGVYRRLLDFYYDTEAPIPKETQSVIRRLRLGSYVDIVSLILEEFFNLMDDGWHNNRADIEISEYKNKVNKARENGKKGGRPKVIQGLETKSVILANPEETTLKANYKLLTNNQELITNINTLVIPSEVTCVPAKEIVELFNKTFPELPQVQKISEVRQKNIRQRWKQNAEMQSLEAWDKFFRFVRSSDFLMGRTSNSWHGLCFDWIFNSSNFTKIYEGNYHNEIQH